MRTLVIGMPGSGKTTYCKEHIGTTGLCYDLDAIAAAFRLKQPHEESHRQAAQLANDLLFAFYTHVNRYTQDVYIIRTSPTLEEFKRINPDKVVICKGQYVRHGTGSGEQAHRIEEIEQYCLRRNIPTEIPERGVAMPRWAK